MKKSFICMLMVLAFGTSALVADIYIKQVSHTEAFSMQGREQPAQDDVIHMWMGNDKMAVEMPQQKIVIDLGKDVMLWINHRNKSYVEMILPLDLEKYFPAQMMQMMGNIDVTVTATGEKQKIGEWECEGYQISMKFMMMNMQQTIWASQDVPFDWKDYSQKMLPKLSQATMYLGEDSLSEMMKIQGFQIKTETSMEAMGTEVKSWQEVQEIVKKTPPAGTYTVPEGYAKKDKLDLKDIQR